MDTGGKLRARRHARGMANWLLAVASTLLCLIAAECLLRLLGPAVASNSHQHRIPHPVFGWVLKPGATYRYLMPEKAVRVSYSSHGWRDVELPATKPPGARRVLVLGDSFMEGYSVDLDDAFHRRVQRQGRRSGSNLQVINLGVGGYGSLQQYRVFRDVGAGLAPDIVVLGFYLGNDLQNNSQVLESLVNPGSMKVASRPFLQSTRDSAWTVTQVDYPGTLRRYHEALKQANGLLPWFERQSALARTIMLVVRSRLSPGVAQPALHERAAPAQVPRAAVLFARHGAHYCDEGAQYTQTWRKTAQILSRLNAAVNDAGARLVVFSVPSQFEVIREEWRDAPDAGLICWDDPPGYRRLAALLSDSDIPFIDLLPAFRQAMRDGRNLFRRSDRHWNEYGHELAATRVLAGLRDAALLPRAKQ